MAAGWGNYGTWHVHKAGTELDETGFLSFFVTFSGKFKNGRIPQARA